jgi:hypothetical protein
MKNIKFMSIVWMVASLLHAAPFTGTVGMTGSTVDVEVVENTFGLVGSETGVAIESGSMDVSVSAGLNQLTLVGGVFTVADTTIDLLSPAGTLSSTGLGFTVENSVLTLTPDSGDTYLISGDLHLVADQGGADVDFPVYDRNFESDPAIFTATLLNTSTVTLTETTPGNYGFTAALRFAATTLDTFTDSGFTVSVNVASENTLNLSGTLSAIPEPASLGLILLGLLGLAGFRRLKA